MNWWTKVKSWAAGNETAEALGYLAILVGLVGALGPWALVSIAGLWWLNEVVDV